MLSKKTKKGQSGLNGCGFVEGMRGNFIPAQSQYTVKFDVLGKEVPFSKDEICEVSCEIRTSAGDVVVPYPDKWKTQLLTGLVFKEMA